MSSSRSTVCLLSQSQAARGRYSKSHRGGNEAAESSFSSLPTAHVAGPSQQFSRSRRAFWGNFVSALRTLVRSRSSPPPPPLGAPRFSNCMRSPTPNQLRFKFHPKMTRTTEGERKSVFPLSTQTRIISLYASVEWKTVRFI